MSYEEHFCYYSLLNDSFLYHISEEVSGSFSEHRGRGRGPLTGTGASQVWGFQACLCVSVSVSPRQFRLAAPVLHTILFLSPPLCWQTASGKYGLRVLFVPN
jgi:hypothetical protein